MDKKNYVVNNSVTRNKFNKILKKIGFKPYSESTINKAFSKLATLELIKRVKGKRGLYRVNPIFFYKGTEEDRVKEIRKILEEPYDKDIDEFRSKLFSKKNP